MQTSGGSCREIAKVCLQSQPSNVRQSQPSLRATGSREYAPDDRLREAIHSFFVPHDGLLPLCRTMDCFASLAMTSQRQR
ncbi:hypothetical protein V1286_006885 [Bradyrhizobium algeriense]|uniref:Transposase n=1 Tax=Bradyrhizobium algeriense TaxID=634784 RepID=A0ABU8BMN3_9BRAD